MPSHYLSIDTEATGLKEHDLLIQIAFVPVDLTQMKVVETLGKEYLVHCPPYEELEPRLDEWNREHNSGLIRRAHAEGISPEKLRTEVSEYLQTPAVRAIFGDKRPVMLGKSMSALDIPIMRRYLGWEFYDKHFHHHTADVTCVARYLVDAGKLPPGCESTSKIIKYFQIRDDANHTALSDAVDMGNVYLKMLAMLNEKKPA